MGVFQFLISVLFLFKNPVCIGEPITLGLASVIVGFSSIYYYERKISCIFNECCDPHSKWLPMNITKLEEDMKTYLHGQHLVELVLLKHLKTHILNDKPSKALLLSFNGMTGTGKNFVSTMIANAMFKKGMKSKFVKLFLTSIHFPIEKNVEEYKLKIQRKIIDTVKSCPHSLFIFDEVHEMPENLLDALKPFVDHYPIIDGVDFRKSIFILISNSGGRNINQILVEARLAGRSRNQLSLGELENALQINLYSMKNDGLRRSKLIAHSLITSFVPFLPMEREQVILCIKSILSEMKLSLDDEVIASVANSLHYHNSSGVELAHNGCKIIADKVQRFLK